MWGDSEHLLASLADLAAQANWLMVVANSDKDGRRKAMRDRPQPIPRPGVEAPGPKRKRRVGPPVARAQLEALGFQVKEVDEDG